MLIRLEFSRNEKMMYLSHLDLMRMFSRAMRRGNIPIKYSSGYNPHAQMVFGLPLQLGVVADADYLDIELDDPVCGGAGEGAGAVLHSNIDLDGFAARLNAVLPDGLRVVGARVKKTGDNAMAIITHATYEMRVGNGAGWYGNDILEADLKNTVAAFLEPGERIVTKEAKPQPAGRRRGGDAIKKTMDLAPLVRFIDARGDVVAMTVRAGSVNNVKPGLVLASLNDVWKKTCGDTCGAGGDRFVRLSLRRKGLFVEQGGVLLKLDDSAFCY